MISKLIVTKKLFEIKIDFFVNNTIVYQGVKKKSVYIINILVDSTLMKVEKKAKWFKTNYSIDMPNSEVINVKSFGGLKINYECNYKNQNYFMYGHKGLKTSIFFDKTQIGYIEKCKKSYSGKTVFDIVTNDDVNPLFICSLSLIIYDDNFSVSDETNDINFDFGNIGPEEFKFNENWKPI
jgi:hypothetical protein